MGNVEGECWSPAPRRNADDLSAVLVAPQSEMEKEKCAHLIATQNAMDGWVPFADCPLESFVNFTDGLRSTIRLGIRLF